MSYARFGWDGSDVYVFKSGGWLECCWCSLASDPVRPLAAPGKIVNFRAFSTAAMVAHLDAHVAAGHHVPDDVTAELWADDRENFPQEVRP